MTARLIDLAKLIRTLRMIGSTDDGKALAAARAAHRLIQDAGLRWRDVIEFRADVRFERDGEIDALIDLGLEYPQIVNDWEGKFLLDVRRQDCLSIRQIDIIEAIARKCRKASAELAPLADDLK